MFWALKYIWNGKSSRLWLEKKGAEAFPAESEPALAAGSSVSTWFAAVSDKEDDNATYCSKGKAVTGVSWCCGEGGLSLYSAATRTQLGIGICPERLHLRWGALVQGSAAVFSSSSNFLQCRMRTFSVSDAFFLPMLFGVHFCFTASTCVASVFFSRCLVEKG